MTDRQAHGPVGLRAFSLLIVELIIAEILLCSLWFVICLVASRVVVEAWLGIPVVVVGFGSIAAGVVGFCVGVAASPRARPSGRWWMSFGALAVVIGVAGVVFAGLLVLAEA